MELKRRENLAWQKLGDDIVIIDARINKEVHRLNEVGSFIWQQLSSSKNEKQICEKLVKEYDISEELALEDIKEFMVDLKEKNLIVEH
jgi:hypothetical protein